MQTPLNALSRVEHVGYGKGRGRLPPIGDTYRDTFAELVRAYQQL